ncbi:hypothetical protein ACIQU5_34025 [Streptomyces sp. NPDC090306]|uniref:hypothetical protein n=1 Tax=unclassified Streptomyces TaxID=2593676 RepID=UPI0036E4DE22
MSRTSDQLLTTATAPPKGTAPHGVGRPRSVFLSYPLLGLLMGGLWAYNHGASLWEHAERLLLIILVVAPLLERARTRRRRREGREGELHVSLPRLILLKLGVVALALVVTAALRGRVDEIDYWVAAGMAVVVSVVGPALHPWMVVGPAEVRPGGAAKGAAG